jgi:hypothetical protein
VGPVGVFNGQVVETKLVLHLPQQLFARLVEADPDEAVRLLKHLANGTKLDGLVPLAAGISHTVDNCSHTCTFAFRK